MSREISIVWHIDDVITRARARGINIIDQQAIEILQSIKHNHDATIGVNWDVIDGHLDMLGTYEEEVEEKSDYKILKEIVSEKRRDCNSSCSNTISSFSKRLGKIEDKLENGEDLTK